MECHQPMLAAGTRKLEWITRKLVSWTRSHGSPSRDVRPGNSGEIYIELERKTHGYDTPPYIVIFV